MIDPRESKLPKWAQDALHEARRRSALSWPIEPRPEPLWEPGTNTYAPNNMDGETVWQAIPARNAPERGVVNGRHINSGQSQFGSRPEHGRYFATEHEAWLDMWWDRAEKAASELYAAQQATEAAQTGRDAP